MAVSGFTGFGAPAASWDMRNKKKQEPQKKETYAASIEQAAGDYDDIMGRFRSLYDQPDPQYDALMKQFSSPSATTPITARNVNYRPSQDVTSALSNLQELSQSGGLSGSNIADLRARGISPIRAVYANAQRNIARQRALQGGYSPNYTAATAKMARDLSEQLAGASTNVEAQIAEMQQRGRLSAAPQYGQAAMNEQGMRTGVEEGNVNRELDAARFNAAQQQQNRDALMALYSGRQNQRMSAAEGLRGLYGTTPANPALYGNQALQRAQLEQQTPAPVKRTPYTGGFQLGSATRRY